MTATPHDVDCHGCDHHTHIPNEFGDCYEYCDTCADALAEYVEAMQAEWEEWKAAGCPVGE